MIGGSGDRTLRVVAQHADIWNIPGPPWTSLDEVRRRGEVLDGHCAAIGRDPAEITRSVYVLAPPDDAAATRRSLVDLVDAGASHLVLGLFPPHGPELVRWVADELIAPVRDQTAVG